MRTWTRATFQELCGGPCGLHIKAGDPMLIIAVPGKANHTVKKFRCVTCAGEPVPTDLHAREDRMVRPAQVMTRFEPDMLPLDFKREASGE